MSAPGVGGDQRVPPAQRASAGSIPARAEDASDLSPRARLLLWDYERGSLAYDLLCLLLFLVVFAVPPAWWGDPMWVRL